MADELTDISDDGTNDFMTIKRDGEDIEVFNREHVQRSRLRIDTRKWLLSKALPKIYGERVIQEISGPNGTPLATTTIATSGDALRAYQEALQRATETSD